MKTLILWVLLLLPACAGLNRGCSDDFAKIAGADWVIVQLNASGQTIRCWKLEGVSVTNEQNSDGIYWKNSKGNLVHLSGFYNRVQVINDNWTNAFAELGLTECPEK